MIIFMQDDGSFNPMVFSKKKKDPDAKEGGEASGLGGRSGLKS